MKRRILILAGIITLLFTFSVYAIEISIDDKKVDFDDYTGKPFIDDNGRTQVPLRETMESFGAKVSWDDSNKIARVTFNGIDVEVPIGQNYIF